MLYGRELMLLLITSNKDVKRWVSIYVKIIQLPQQDNNVEHVEE